MFLLKNDIVSFSIAFTGVWEPAETEVVKRYVHPGDVAIDIGAHIGYYTLLLSKLVGEEGRVYSFEPQPTLFELLRKNVDINNCHNVVLVQKAVSDRNGERIYDSESIRLDDYLARERVDVDFIKIDIEGHESYALRGAKMILSMAPSLCILAELCPSWMEAQGVGLRDYLDYLIELGFRLYRVDAQEGILMPIPEASVILNDDRILGGSITLLCEKVEDQKKGG